MDPKVKFQILSNPEFLAEGAPPPTHRLSALERATLLCSTSLMTRRSTVHGTHVGTAMDDLKEPDRVLIGGEQTEAGKAVLAARSSLKAQDAPFPFWFYMAPAHR